VAGTRRSTTRSVEAVGEGERAGGSLGGEVGFGAIPDDLFERRAECGAREKGKASTSSSSTVLSLRE